jgi:hypothetical protein
MNNVATLSKINEAKKNLDKNYNINSTFDSYLKLFSNEQ